MIEREQHLDYAELKIAQLDLWQMKDYDRLKCDGDFKGGHAWRKPKSMTCTEIS